MSNLLRNFKPLNQNAAQNKQQGTLRRGYEPTFSRDGRRYAQPLQKKVQFRDESKAHLTSEDTVSPMVIGTTDIMGVYASSIVNIDRRGWQQTHLNIERGAPVLQTLLEMVRSSFLSSICRPKFLQRSSAQSPSLVGLETLRIFRALDRFQQSDKMEHHIL